MFTLFWHWGPPLQLPEAQPTQYFPEGLGVCLPD